MIPLDEAITIVDNRLCNSESGVETVSAGEALGRVLAEDQFSGVELPPFDKALRDGFAVPANGKRDEYRIVETIPAGKIPSRPLGPGEAARIMTGAAVPEGAAGIIKVEDTETSGETVRILQHSGPPNISPKAEDVREGDRIMVKGTLIQSHHVATLVSCGIREIPVARRLRVCILCTGSEIVDDFSLLGPGKIMNSNGPMLSALVREFGMETALEKTVPDDLDDTVQAVKEALPESDIVIISGGVSMGDYDYVLPALAELGLEVHFSKVRIKPGKPVTFASGGGKTVFGLPGNPVSVYLSFHMFVLRAAALMSGAVPRTRSMLLALAVDHERQQAGRRGFIPAAVDPEGRLHPVEYHGSAHIRVLNEADGFFVMPMDKQKAAAGEKVRFYPMMRGFL